jgi:16S rRNA (cytosine1402-N4)-methyltransferase
MSTYHTPVLLHEVIEGLRIEKGRRYIDATLGGGGHFEEIIRLGGDVLGIDCDPEALEYTRKRLEPGTWRLAHGNFRDIKKIANDNGFGLVDGILFDLGVSSHQLDTEGRGFSYRFAFAPLDLRLDQNSGQSAAEYLRTVSEGELYEVLATFGEEERAGAIAHAICRSRHVKPIRLTGDVVTIVSGIVSDQEKNSTLSRVFQALRMVINDEKNNLKIGLVGASELLNREGRLVVISFHSLEDRVVKQFMIGQKQLNVFTKKPIIASLDEIQHNKRARSAKLRISEKV